MFYVLLDVSCTGIQIDSIDLRTLQSPSLIAYWASYSEVPTRIYRLALLVVDADTGKILKNIFGTNTEVSSYELEMLSFVSVSSDNWNTRPRLSFLKNRVIDIYGSIDLFKRKLQLYPSYSLISSIIG